MLLSALTIPKAVAQVIINNIECTSIQGGFVTVGQTSILVNSPGPAEFTTTQEAIDIPFEALVPNSNFVLNIPLNHDPVAAGVNTTFSEVTTGLPIDISSTNVSAVATAGSTQTILTKTFSVGPSPGFGTGNIQVTQNNQIPVEVSPAAPFGGNAPTPSCPLCRSIQTNLTPGGHIIELVPFVFTQSQVGAVIRFSLRVNFQGFTPGTDVQTDLRWEAVPNPYFTFVGVRDNATPVTGNVISQIFPLPNAPAASGVVVPVEIQARVEGSCG